MRSYPDTVMEKSRMIMSRVSGNRCRITWRITSGEIGELISKTISPLAASPMAIGAYAAPPAAIF